jgi:hypothetical protein
MLKFFFNSQNVGFWQTFAPKKKKKEKKKKKLLKSQTSNRPYLSLVSSGFFLGFKKKKTNPKWRPTIHPSIYPPIHPSEHDEKGSYHPLKDLAKSGYINNHI